MRYNRNARFYDFLNYIGERLYFSRYRRGILHNVKGKILEVGVAVDLSDKMLERAVKKAQF